MQPACDTATRRPPPTLSSSVQSTHSVVSPGAHRLFIGPPDANMHAYVVDRALRLVPLAALGELILSGPRVTAGV